MEKIKTYIINLKRDTVKRHLIEIQMKENSFLDFEFIEAVDGRTLSDNDLKTQTNMEVLAKRYKEVASLPGIGCALSHYYTYKKINIENDEAVLILEDDAILSKNLKDICYSIIESFDISLPYVFLLTPGFSYKQSDLVKIIANTKIYEISGGMMTSGYIINKSAAHILAENIYPISHLPDDWRRLISYGIKLYGVLPHIISFPDGYGEIGNSVLQSFANRKKTLWGKISFFLARVKGVLYSLTRSIKGERKSKKLW